MKLMTSLVLGFALVAAPLAACDGMGGPHAQKSSISKNVKKAQASKKAKAKVANLTQDKQAKI